MLFFYYNFTELCSIIYSPPPVCSLCYKSCKHCLLIIWLINDTIQVKKTKTIKTSETTKEEKIMDAAKKAAKWMVIVFGVMTLLFVIYAEIHLVTHEETTFGDIVSVAKINLGADYAVLSTAQDSETIMVKDANNLKAFLSRKGCTKKNGGSRGTCDYETKDGKAFSVCSKTDGGIYSTYTIKGVKIEEIAWSK